MTEANTTLSALKTAGIREVFNGDRAKFMEYSYRMKTMLALEDKAVWLSCDVPTADEVNSEGNRYNTDQRKDFKKQNNRVMGILLASVGSRPLELITRDGNTSAHVAWKAMERAYGRISPGDLDRAYVELLKITWHNGESARSFFTRIHEKKAQLSMGERKVDSSLLLASIHQQVPLRHKPLARHIRDDHDNDEDRLLNLEVTLVEQEEDESRDHSRSTPIALVAADIEARAPTISDSDYLVAQITERVVAALAAEGHYGSKHEARRHPQQHHEGKHDAQKHTQPLVDRCRIHPRGTHTNSECRVQRNERNSQQQSKQRFTFSSHASLSTETSGHQEQHTDHWVGDSGSTDHICSCRDKFSDNYSPLPPTGTRSVSVMAANGQTSPHSESSLSSQRPADEQLPSVRSA
ncbi:MAG: hypothetical protein JKY60_20430, partial [Kordiimonadaceae bacterium]|nr:hypothetical protein [Kordiimonadaceae bacterium]